jgi:thiol-disulfide isomerase/thioredoxin
MVVITTRCCLNRVDLQHRKSLSSHSDAVSRREQAEARKRKRKQQERSANVALRTAVDFNDLKEQKRRTNPNGEVGLFEQASNSVISWAENLGLIDAHANVKANIRSRFDFDKYVKEGIHRQHNNNDNDILGSSSEKMKISGEREGASTSGGIVVAMFGAPWCKACEAMQNKMLEVYRAHADVTFIRVDAKHNLQLCRDLGVKKLPWFQIYTPNTQKLAASPSTTQMYGTKEDRPKLVVNVHANKENQNLLSRQIQEIKKIMAQ